MAQVPTTAEKGASQTSEANQAPGPGFSQGRGGTRGRPRGRPPGPNYRPARPLGPTRGRGRPPGVTQGSDQYPRIFRGGGRPPGSSRGGGRGQVTATMHGRGRGRGAAANHIVVSLPLVQPSNNMPSQPVLDSRSVPLVVAAPKRIPLRKSRQRIAAEKSSLGDSDNVYEVEAILNDANFGGVHLFELKWKGVSLAETTWVTRSDLENCKELYENYMRNRPVNTADLRKFYVLVSEAQSTQPIVISNTVDKVGCPENFTYINENIYSEDIPRPCTPVCFCSCTDNCVNDCECVEERYYDNEGIVITGRTVPLMECGPKCACNEDCVTRVIQKGSNVNLEIFRTKHKGWGVRSRQHIKKGTFIAEYVGEVISSEDADRRGVEDTAAGLTYLFDLDMNTPVGAITEYSIDAKTHGNVSHFFNHSCGPNMEIRQVFVEHRDPRLHRLVFFTTKDVEPKEELVFDYNLSSDGIGKATIQCFCGSDNCRKVIVF